MEKIGALMDGWVNAWEMVRKMVRVSFATPSILSDTTVTVLYVTTVEILCG